MAPPIAQEEADAAEQERDDRDDAAQVLRMGDVRLLALRSARRGSGARGGACRRP